MLLFKSKKRGCFYLLTVTVAVLLFVKVSVADTAIKNRLEQRIQDRVDKEIGLLIADQSPEISFFSEISFNQLNSFENGYLSDRVILKMIDSMPAWELAKLTRMIFVTVRLPASFPKEIKENVGLKIQNKFDVRPPNIIRVIFEFSPINSDQPQNNLEPVTMVSPEVNLPFPPSAELPKQAGSRVLSDRNDDDENRSGKIGISLLLTVGLIIGLFWLVIKKILPASRKEVMPRFTDDMSPAQKVAVLLNMMDCHELWYIFRLVSDSKLGRMLTLMEMNRLCELQIFLRDQDKKIHDRITARLTNLESDSVEAFLDPEILRFLFEKLKLNTKISQKITLLKTTLRVLSAEQKNNSFTTLNSNISDPKFFTENNDDQYKKSS